MSLCVHLLSWLIQSSWAWTVSPGNIRDWILPLSRAQRTKQYHVVDGIRQRREERSGKPPKSCTLCVGTPGRCSGKTTEDVLDSRLEGIATDEAIAEKTTETTLERVSNAA
ncbi:hypothetical protein BDW68DRAFT_171589 [Aspergillus falconensis]